MSCYYDRNMLVKKIVTGIQVIIVSNCELQIVLMSFMPHGLHNPRNRSALPRVIRSSYCTLISIIFSNTSAYGEGGGTIIHLTGIRFTKSRQDAVLILANRVFRP